MLIIRRTANGLYLKSIDKRESENPVIEMVLEEQGDEEVKEYKFTRRALYVIGEMLGLSFGSKHDVKLELIFTKDGEEVDEA